MGNIGNRVGWVGLVCLFSFLGLAAETRAQSCATNAAAAGKKFSARPLDMRGGGVLLAMSSLPGDYGVGDFGAGHEFVRWLIAAGQKWWQVLPLNPSDVSNSPFSSESGLAIDSAYLDLQNLVILGLLKASDLTGWRQPNSTKADYAQARAVRADALDAAYDEFEKNGSLALRREFNQFRRDNAYWLRDHSSFIVFKKLYGYDFTLWSEDLRNATPSAVRFERVAHRKEVLRVEFEQFLLHRQWKALKKFANDNGISVIGDMPLYMARYSADVWANSEAFQLDGKKRPKLVSGYPKCNFYKKGQLWGTPVYDWEGLARTKFAFWVKRVKRNLELYDAVRIDHFLGLHQYFAIENGKPDALEGKWLPARGEDLMARLVKVFGKSVALIAEDLGSSVPKEVHDLRKKYSIPGMYVLQFGHGGDQPDQYHTVANHAAAGVAYAGNHDTPTMKQWMSGTPKLDLTTVWEWVERLYGSKANLAIISAQDLLGLDGEARMNLPGTWSGAPTEDQRRDNWVWRLMAGQLDDELAKKLRQLTDESER